MGCDHKGAPELIEMAEEHLRSEGVPESQWTGRSFRWSENVDGGTWASVIVEIRRGEDDWIATRLDRMKSRIEETGFLPL